MPQRFLKRITDLRQAETALESDETPVGCVFVYNNEVIGRGINGTNASLNVGFQHGNHLAKYSSH